MKIKVPEFCPSCNYPLTMTGEQLFCRNTACEAQIGKKIEHFAKVLRIKGLGPVSLKKLNLSDITEIFYLDRNETIAVLGEKNTDKLLQEIEASKNADLATVLTSFSIPLCGETASKKIASIVTERGQITEETCQRAGLGEKVTSNLLEWLANDYQELKEFLPFSFKAAPVKEIDPDSQTVCITGRLKSFKLKSEAYAALEAAGYTIVESVTKATNILIDETDKTSEKRKKAELLGVLIITDLKDLL